MIEVSNDGEKWDEEPRKFHHIWKSIASMDDRDWYQTKREWIEHWKHVTTYELWKYARPAPEELKLEPLPDFDPNKIPTSFAIPIPHPLCKQVQLLTERVNLISKR